MTRAEMKRAEREKKKAKTATYNFTQEQLDILVQEKIRTAIDQAKSEAVEEATNIALALLLTLPCKVLIDHYWPKTYDKKLPGFVDYIAEYYLKWETGELDMDELKTEIWEKAGIRIEAEQVDE